jgi:hypothetical protein
MDTKKSHRPAQWSSTAGGLDVAPSPTQGCVMQDMGRVLLVLGFAVAAVGAVMLLLPQMPWLGRLPGDVRIERERFTIYVPIVSCLVVSGVLTLILNLFFRR